MSTGTGVGALIGSGAGVNGRDLSFGRIWYRVGLTVELWDPVELHAGHLVSPVAALTVLGTLHAQITSKS